MRRYLRPVQAVAASFLTERADVEDAVQETFVKALNGMGGYAPERPFAPWLYQIARNVAKSRLSDPARRRMVPFPTRELTEPAGGPDSNVERAEIRRLVDEALEALPEQRRVAFRLHDVEGMETSEVARMMGISAGTVRSHVHHARRALRAALTPKLGETDDSGDEADATLVE